MLVRNIAVCLYGQWRTGDHVVSHIKHLFDQIPDVNVDYFCSVKAEYSYTNDSRYESGKVTALDSEHKDHIADTLRSTLDPKQINFISDDDITFTNMGPVLAYSIIDSVLLKQQYEADTDLVYDIVFLHRYDVGHEPYDRLDRFINDLRAAQDDHVFFEPDNLFADRFTPQPSYTQRHMPEPWLIFNDTINDLLVASSGSAIDRIVYHMLDYINYHSSLLENKTFIKYDSGSYAGLNANLHLFITRSCRMLGIHNPTFEVNQITDPAGANTIVVRQTPELEDCDLNNLDDFIAIGNVWGTVQRK